MDPGRFVAQHQSQFFIVGFHDEERSDEGGVNAGDVEEVGVANNSGSNSSSSGSRSHPMRLSFGSLNGAMRNTLSPVREQADPVVGVGGPLGIVPQIRVGLMNKHIVKHIQK